MPEGPVATPLSRRPLLYPDVSVFRERKKFFFLNYSKILNAPEKDFWVSENSGDDGKYCL